MEFSFDSTCHIGDSDDPTLHAILQDCEIEAEFTIHCDADSDGAYPSDLQIHNISFQPPDSPAAVKAQALMHRELMESICREVERKIHKDWRRYEREAAEHYRDLEDAAADAAYEAWKERGGGY